MDGRDGFSMMTNCPTVDFLMGNRSSCRLFHLSSQSSSFHWKSFHYIQSSPFHNHSSCHCSTMSCYCCGYCCCIQSFPFHIHSSCQSCCSILPCHSSCQSWSCSILSCRTTTRVHASLPVPCVEQRHWPRPRVRVGKVVESSCFALFD